MNNEYVRKEDAKDVLQEKVFHNLTDEFYGAMQAIDELPSADVVQVVHAYWIDTENYYRRWRCSACSGHTKETHPPFCPFCGAKMDAQGEG